MTEDIDKHVRRRFDVSTRCVFPFADASIHLFARELGITLLSYMRALGWEKELMALCGWPRRSDRGASLL